jgi:hypothetical protein
MAMQAPCNPLVVFQSNTALLLVLSLTFTIIHPPRYDVNLQSDVESIGERLNDGREEYDFEAAPAKHNSTIC